MMKTALFVSTLVLVLTAALAPASSAAPEACYGIQRGDACTGHSYYANSASCVGVAEHAEDCTGYWYDNEEFPGQEPDEAPVPASCTVQLWEGGPFLYSPLTGEPFAFRSEAWLCLG